MKPQEFRGEITAFLSLIFVLMLSLVGALIQSSSIHISRSRARSSTQMALESYFAEYHAGLWEEYGILAREGTDEKRIAKRLEFYGAAYGTHEVQNSQRLSDGGGQAFYEQAVRLMGGTPSDSNSVITPDNSMEIEERENERELEDLLKAEEKELPEEDNPIHAMNQLKKSGLLQLIHPSPETLSVKEINLENVASQRLLKEGNVHTPDSGKEGLTEKVWFTSYLTAYFCGYSGEQDDQHNTVEREGLEYELEYLLQGNASDQANLEGVAKKILGARMAVNYAHILADSTKKAEAEAMALTLAALLSAPAASEIVKHAILLAWAYGESVVDLRVLFQGKKVPVIKTAENWQLQLSNLSKLGTEDESVAESDGTQGMSYEDYLKGLLLIADSNALCMHALDLMELKLGIKTDECVTVLKIQSSRTLQRGIRDTFVTEYQYD